MLDASVISVLPTQLNLRIDSVVRGRLHITEVADVPSVTGSPAPSPLAAFKKGQQLRVRVIGHHDARTRQYLPLSHPRLTQAVLECSLRPSVVADGQDAVTDQQETANTSYIRAISDFAAGQQLPGFVASVDASGAWIHVTPHLRGRVPTLLLADKAKALTSVKALLQEGQYVNTWVTKVDVEQNHLDLSLVDPAERTPVSVGQRRPVKVSKILDQGLLVEVAPQLLGRVALTDLFDDFVDNPLQHFAVDSFLDAVVVEVKEGSKKSGDTESAPSPLHVDLSLRPSRVDGKKTTKVVDPEISSFSQLVFGRRYRGYVTAVSDVGVFVALGRNVVGLLRTSELADDAAGNTPAVGTVVSVTALKVSSDKVSLSVRRAAGEEGSQAAEAQHNADEAEGPAVTWDMLKAGQQYQAKVASVTDYGVFLRLPGPSKVVGLAPKAKCGHCPAEGRLADFYAKNQDYPVKVSWWQCGKSLRNAPGNVCLFLVHHFFDNLMGQLVVLFIVQVVNKRGTKKLTLRILTEKEMASGKDIKEDDERASVCRQPTNFFGLKTQIG